MIEILIACGFVFLLVSYASISRAELLPLATAVFVCTYPVWADRYFQFGPFETEASYISLMAWWGCLGAIYRRGQIYLVGLIVHYMVFITAVFIVMDWASYHRLISIDFANIITWFLTLSIYLMIVRKSAWSWPRHIAAATVASVSDLAIYFALAQLIQMDPHPAESVLEVYSGNLVLLPFLILLFSVPPLFARVEHAEPVPQRRLAYLFQKHDRHED